MPNGILIIDKPQGWTSMDVCAKIRGILHEKRVGHGGTLDPMATGVLPVFVGQATRAVEFAENGRKEYVAGLRLGQVTNTQDVTGETLETHPVTATRLARKGKEVERKPRPITIYELELLEQVSETDYTFRCVCSKGTYIRTLCHDIGQALGCGGTLYSLRRTMAAGYTTAQAHTMEEVQERGESLLQPVDTLFAQYPAYTVPSAGKETRVRNGGAVTDASLPDGTYRVYGRNGDFLCLSRAQRGTLTSIKNFFGA